MINKNNFKALLKYLGFDEKGNIYNKRFGDGGYLSADFKKEVLQYPESDGLKISERQTCNFSSAENAVVFECVCRLLEKGYKPKHIELEPKWKLGHGGSGGRADILVKDQNNKPLLIIECKTYGKEFNKAWKETLDDGGQLFSYAQQIAETEFLSLYASEFDTKQKQLFIEQRIISHKDNEKILELGEQLKSYQKASNVKRRYDVWKETYQLEHTETGIFEQNIPSYKIGKSHYTLDIDTRPVTEKDKEGKYHRFRTILRQHNIARRETAFEVLVNLFLAKIVDEEENKTNLEFYWKGVAYDNYYDFIDRLQKLYQIGMRKFLKDEVMYISSEQIDGAFWAVKNEKNATKKQIQKYFRDLKFFSNNAFSLINVHNERLFNRNTKVLVELVQMWQGLRLKTKQQNQFLGDMFEYFLDNSIKQSEGQFFTPMPITQFIVASLPLKNKIRQSSEPLKVIDFACGAGHFLTEYAHQIKPLVEQYKKIDISQYYENIIGIEKEDRLAKIAKVSAYMYGQNQIKIIEEDALSDIGDIGDIKLNSYDVLVANPPFAVEGFLLNLNDKQKEVYELIKTTELNSNTNNIQCFFIERAKQLMAGGGVVGIIVPSSVLSNSDSTHIGTREILLKYFDLVALVELGSGTFGKTGTNTVVMFLRRKAKKPEPAEHYQNRVDDYFAGEAPDHPNQEEYQDIYLIQQYCKYNELPFDDYIKLFAITPETINTIDELLKTELFADYKKAFEYSTEIKNLKKKKFFKDKTPQKKQLELAKRLINYLYTIEKDKLYYFILAFENRQKVLIVKSPSNNKERKRFLGYQWSGAKGSEGIKYSAGSTVNDIITPLFNPKNTQDKSKINYLIEQNFLGNEVNDLKEFEQYKELINYANVADILDFSRTDFNKSFSLTPKRNITINTKWELVKLGDLCEKPQYGANESAIDGDHKKDYRYIRITDINENGQLNSDWKSAENIADQYKLEEGDFLFARSGATVGKTFLYKQAHGKAIYAGYLIRFRTKADQLNPVYLKNITELDYYKKWVKFTQIGTSQPNINAQMYSELKIPLPPKAIQEKMVAECEVIDKATEQAQQTIEQAKKGIEEEVKTVFNAGYENKRLDEICNMQAGKFVSASEIKDKQTDDLYPCYGGNGLRGYTKTFTHEGTYSLIGRQGALCGNVHKISGTFHATEHAIVATTNSTINVDWFYHILTSLNLNQYATGVAQPGLSVKNIKPVQIPIPSLSQQKTLIAKIEKLKQKTNQAQTTIKNAPQQKQQILDMYLK